jgi:hypothetical protein
MSLTERYELNNPPMIAELVEGEVIAIDLDRGSYYSLVGPAAEVWSALIAGRSGQEILAAANTALDQGPAANLQGFVESLLAEQLIRRAAPQGGAPGTPLAPIAPWPGDCLRFERFTDMQDLLILDPIHEVDDEAGWPKPVG